MANQQETRDETGQMRVGHPNDAQCEANVIFVSDGHYGNGLKWHAAPLPAPRVFEQRHFTL
jgi:hypothetical protein